MGCIGPWLSGVGLCLVGAATAGAAGLFYDAPDQGEPGDVMIREYLQQETEKVESGFLSGIKSLEDWEQTRPRWRQEYLDMLGCGRCRRRRR